MKKILVADDEMSIRLLYSEELKEEGYEVYMASNGREALEVVDKIPLDLVILDIKMPEMDGIEAANRLYNERPVPVILVSAFHDPGLIHRAEADHVLGYLVKPIKQADLEPVIALAMRRFAQFEALRQEAADLRQALDDRKLIERAKGILMKQARLDEAEAFARLQKLASEKNLKLAELARIILTADEAMRPNG